MIPNRLGGHHEKCHQLEAVAWTPHREKWNQDELVEHVLRELLCPAILWDGESIVSHPPHHSKL